MLHNFHNIYNNNKKYLFDCHRLFWYSDNKFQFFFILFPRIFLMISRCFLFSWKYGYLLKLDKDYIFCKIQAPVTKTGRSYEILKEDWILIDNQYSKLQKIWESRDSRTIQLSLISATQNIAFYFIKIIHNWRWEVYSTISMVQWTL